MKLIPGKLYRVKEEMGASHNRKAGARSIDIDPGSTLLLLQEEHVVKEKRLYCQFLFGMKTYWITFCDNTQNPYVWAEAFLDPIS